MSFENPNVLDRPFNGLVGGWGAGEFSPTMLSNLAAWYDISDASSLSINGSNQVQLVADKSGNSPVNAFCSSGAASNTATTATKDITGNVTITADVRFADYTPSANHTLFSKLSGNDGIEALLLTTGVLRLRIGNGASVTNVDSTASVPTTDLARATFALIWQDGVGATFTVNGAALGVAVAAAITLTNAATTATIGTSCAGVIYRVQVGSVYDFNPASASKLATTVADGVSGTWAINTSGDLGARISGERDLVQMTAANRPVYTAASGGVPAYITGDGSNDYMKAAPFSLSQPETVYFVGSQVTWTINDQLYDGNGLSNRMGLYQQTATPRLTQFAGADGASITSLAVATRAVLTSVFNGASSGLRSNRGAAATGNPGTDAGNGFVLFARADIANYANATASEILIYSAAHGTNTQNRVIQALARRNGIPGV